MVVSYEWNLELVDDFGDILNSEQFDKIADALASAVVESKNLTGTVCRQRLGLLRDDVVDEGCGPRDYAYIRPNGTMAYDYRPALAVPKQFLRSVAANFEAIKTLSLFGEVEE